MSSRNTCVRLLIGTLLAFTLVLSLAADECTYAYPSSYYATYTCDTANTDGPCALSKPVSFSLYSWSYPKSCATVVWDFGDGSPTQTVNGAQTVQHTYLDAKSYEVTAKINTPGYSWANTESLDFTVAHGRLKWSGVDSSINEGESQTVGINRTNPTGPIEVTWRLEMLDGSPATDFSPASGTVMMANGQATAEIVLHTVDDSSYKDVRTYKLTAGVTGGFLPPLDADLYFIDNDYSILSFATGSLAVHESAGLVQVTVLRTGDPNVSVSAHYGTWGSNRVVPTSGWLVFDPGVTSRSFNVVINNDSIWTGDGTTYLDLEYPTGGAHIGSPDTIPLVIKEDDPLTSFSVTNIGVLEGDTGLTEARFTVTASQPLYTYLYYQLHPGTAKPHLDYAPRSGVLFFNGERGTIVVPIIGDHETEDDETFRLHFTSSSHDTTLPQDLTCTILNDDAGMGPAIVRIPAGGTGRVLLDIGAPAASPILIPLSSSDPGSVTVPSSLTIPSGSRKASFLAHGLAKGSARISATMPAERGGDTLTVRASVYRAATLRFDPARVEAFVGQEIPVHVTMTPPNEAVLEITLTPTGHDVISVPQSFTLAPGGTGTIMVKALAVGHAGVQMIVPDDSDEAVTLEVIVNDPATTPALASISPTTGPAAGGTAFTAFGSLLTPDCSLRFGGVPAAGLAITADGALTGLTPPHAAGTVDVDLACGASQFMLSDGFTYLAAPPSLSSITPAFGSTEGGTLVRASGANFQSGCWMFFAGVAAAAVEIESPEELIAATPPRDAPGAVETTVKCGNDAVSVAAAFVYTSAVEPSASIISVDPLVGAPGDSITITGSRFQAADAIRFDEVPATVLRTRPDEHVVRIPELPLGMSSINVLDAGDRLTTTGPIFMVVEPIPPQITRATPSRVLPGSEIVLEGHGFRPAYSFSIGGVTARTISVDSTRVRIRLGETEPGAHPIHALRSTGQVAAVGPAVTVLGGQLRLQMISPPCSVNGGGIEVVLRGLGFAEGAVVTFNGVAASGVEVMSATEIHAVAPPAAVGLAQVVVTNPNGDQASITGAFGYYSPFDPQGGCPQTRTRGVRH